MKERYMIMTAILVLILGLGGLALVAFGGFVPRNAPQTFDRGVAIGIGFSMAVVALFLLFGVTN